MGFFSTIAGWLKPAARIVKKVVQTVNDWVNGPSISEDYYDYIKKNPFDRKNQPQNQYPYNQSNSPNFWGDSGRSSVERNLLSKITDLDKKIDQQQSEQSVANKRLALQIDFMKLAMSATAFDRYTNNIQLHASNLSIHLHTLRNIKGLTDDVNHLRFGLKRSIGTINHLANIINNAGIGRVNKLEGINVEMNDGAISLYAAYRAFEQTRNLLVQEIVALSNLADEHAADIYRVKLQAQELGALGSEVTQFLDNKVLPKIHRTKQMGIFLKNQISELPVISEEPITDELDTPNFQNKP